MPRKAKLVNIESVILEAKPKPVTNQAAYAEYLKLKNNPILNENRHQTASDGTQIDLSWFPNILKKRTEHLTIAEQKKYMTMKEIYFKIQSKRNGFKMKAYAGHTIGDEGDTIETLYGNRRQDIIELFGRMFSIKEVYQIASQDWKLKTSINQLQMYRTANLDVILAKIEEHKRTYSDIRLGHKRSRLEELTWLYMKRKAMYNYSGKADDHRLLLQTIEQIRKEAEGDKITLDGNITHNMDGAINELIEKDLTKNLSIKELILARVASKTHTPVAKLISDLSKGWYSKLLNRSAEDAEVEIVYPSTQTYDFDHIAKVVAVNEQKEKYEEAIVVIDPDKIKVGNDIKAALLAKLTRKSGDTQSEKNDLNPHFIDKANRAM